MGHCSGFIVVPDKKEKLMVASAVVANKVYPEPSDL